MKNEEINAANKLAEEQTGIDINPSQYPALVNKDDVPIGYHIIQRPKPLEKADPTIHDTIGSAFRQYNLPYRAAKSILELRNPFNARSTREEGYDPIGEGLLDDIPEEFHSNILQETNRQDAQLVRQNIQKELEDKDIMARSGTLLNMASTLGAVIVDPTNLIGFAQTIKYASVSKGFFANSIEAGKILAPAIAMQNAALVATKETEGLYEWAFDTMLESFIASGIGGLAGAYAAKVGKAELKGAKAYFKAVEKDVDIKVKLGPNGEDEGLKAVSSIYSGNVTSETTAGTAYMKMGIAEAEVAIAREQVVQDIQNILDSGVSFKDNPWVNNALFKWGSPGCRVN